jgi:hypothetical protein
MTSQKVGGFIRSNVLGLTAVFIALTGTALADQQSSGGGPRASASIVTNAKFKKLKRKVNDLQAQVDQIARQPGPQGIQGVQGLQGLPGTPGQDGSARAYAVIHGSFCGLPISACSITRSKGVAYAIHVATGDFCVGVNNISAADATSLAVVTPTVGASETWALWRGASLGGNINCVGSEFEVVTGTGTGAGQTSASRDFAIVIP